MGLRERTERYFRKRLRDERERRGWSQEELARRLSEHGVDMYTSTIAKIETGARAIRLDEVAGAADLFGLSVDVMLGRKGGLPDEADHVMDALAETAERLASELREIEGRWSRAFGDLEGQFGRLPSYEGYIYGDARWNVEDMPDEYRRAVLIRLCRDEAMWHLGSAVAAMLSVREYQSMMPTELPGALKQAQTYITEERRKIKSGTTPVA